MNEKDGGAIGYLAAELERRYGMRDLSKGYFPLSSGELAVSDPLTDFLVMGETLAGDAMAFIENALLHEEGVYDLEKKSWESQEQETAFNPFSSFCETSFNNFYRLYTRLIRVNQPRPESATSAIAQNESHKGWAFETYGKDIIRRFGGLDIVDPGMIPIGLVHLYKTSRVRWDQ